MDSKYDPTFLEIIREEKNIASFLDMFFGFLYRCTDFYVVSKPDEHFGFPPGIAENLVVTTFRKWQSLNSFTRQLLQPQLRQKLVVAPSTSKNVTADVTVNVGAVCKDAKQETQSKTSGHPQQQQQQQQKSASDCYNGASYRNYRWSQTINELDVVILVPETARSAKDVRVQLSMDELEVAAIDSIEKEGSSTDWRMIIKGRFPFKIKYSESYWCLEPGRHINLHLEKAYERWWELLLDNEPRIQLSKIDCSRNLEEMSEGEEMKMEELMWNQRRKLLGQSTSEETRMEQALQDGWDVNGSPFKGTKYDSSFLKFN